MRRPVFRMLVSCRFLRSWLHVLRLLVLLLLCHQPLIRLLRLLLVVRVVVFIVITVVEMDMWMPSAIGRRKLRRLRLTVLHIVLLVLVLEDLKRFLLVQRHELLMLLHHLAASMSSVVVGSMTRSTTVTGPATSSQSSTLGPPSAHSPGTYP
jgi:hypothetical protein